MRCGVGDRVALAVAADATGLPGFPIKPFHARGDPATLASGFTFSTFPGLHVRLPMILAHVVRASSAYVVLREDTPVVVEPVLIRIPVQTSAPGVIVLDHVLMRVALACFITRFETLVR